MYDTLRHWALTETRGLSKPYHWALHVSALRIRIAFSFGLICLIVLSLLVWQHKCRIGNNIDNNLLYFVFDAHLGTETCMCKRFFNCIHLDSEPKPSPSETRLYDRLPLWWNVQYIARNKRGILFMHVYQSLLLSSVRLSYSSKIFRLVWGPCNNIEDTIIMKKTSASAWWTVAQQRPYLIKIILTGHKFPYASC